MKNTLIYADTIPVYCTFSTLVDISELIPNEKNPKIHTEDQIELLAKIIQLQGWRNPITVSLLSGKIVKGEGRFRAAKLLNVKEVPVDFQHYDSEELELADLIADNRIAELALIEEKKLTTILQDIIDSDLETDLCGYNDTEIELLIQNIANDVETIDDFFEKSDTKTEKEKKQIKCPHCGLPINE